MTKPKETGVRSRLAVAAFCLLAACSMAGGSSASSGSAGSASGASSGGGGASGTTGSASPDGTYQCQGDAQGGDSCSEPWMGGSVHWTLELAGDALTLTSSGFDQDHYSCTGQWTGTTFDCSLSWSRAGRACNNTAHLAQRGSNTLQFWLGSVTTTTATCSR